MRNRLSVLVLAGAILFAPMLPMTAFAVPVHDAGMAPAVGSHSETGARTGRDIIVSRDDKDKD